MTSADRTATISRWRLAGGVLEGAFYLAYPFVVYAARTRLEARGVGALVLALFALSLFLRTRGAAAGFAHVLRQHLPLAALVAAAVVLNDQTLLLLLPALVSVYLLGTFAWSLYRGPPMIERFARMVEDDLPGFTLPYCRRVTIVWCVFFAANATIVTGLAAAAPLAWWTLYTGLVFNLLIGLLLASEFCLRKWWFRYYGDGPVDRIFARLFPPEQTAIGRRSLDHVERRRNRLRAETPQHERRVDAPEGEVVAHQGVEGQR